MSIFPKYNVWRYLLRIADCGPEKHCKQNENALVQRTDVHLVLIYQAPESHGCQHLSNGFKVTKRGKLKEIVSNPTCPSLF